MAHELESALGGVYSVLSQEFQLPLINLILQKLIKEGKMPDFPKGKVKPQVVTGLEALGRGQDLTKLAQFLEYLAPLGPEVIAQKLNVDDYMDRLGASLGIDTGGLIKSEEQLQQEQAQAQEAQQAQMQEAQQAQMQEAQHKGAVPPVAKGMAEGMKDNPEMAEIIQQAMASQMSGNA
jgi:DNA invertase Pin-like site-specific DNA recombinase